MTKFEELQEIAADRDEELVDDRLLSLYKEGESFDEAIKRYIYAIWKEES